MLFVFISYSFIILPGSKISSDQPKSESPSQKSIFFKGILKPYTSEKLSGRLVLTVSGIIKDIMLPRKETPEKM